MYRALDIGGNPDISTLDLFKQGLQENQATKGKVQALQQLRLASRTCVCKDIISLEWFSLCTPKTRRFRQQPHGVQTWMLPQDFPTNYLK